MSRKGFQRGLSLTSKAFCTAVSNLYISSKIGYVKYEPRCLIMSDLVLAISKIISAIVITETDMRDTKWGELFASQLAKASGQRWECEGWHAISAKSEWTLIFSSIAYRLVLLIDDGSMGWRVYGFKLTNPDGKPFTNTKPKVKQFKNNKELIFEIAAYMNKINVANKELNSKQHGYALAFQCRWETEETGTRLTSFLNDLRTTRHWKTFAWLDDSLDFYHVCGYMEISEPQMNEARAKEVVNKLQFDWKNIKMDFRRAGNILEFEVKLIGLTDKLDMPVHYEKASGEERELHPLTREYLQDMASDFAAPLDGQSFDVYTKSDRDSDTVRTAEETMPDLLNKEDPFNYDDPRWK